MTPFESLESRQMLDAVTANLSKTGVLTITGSSHADTILLKQVGYQIQIDAGTEFSSADPDLAGGKVDITKVKRIVVNAGGSRDYVEVDRINSRKAIAIQINGDGANDTLISRTKDATLRGGAGNDYLLSDPAVLYRFVYAASLATAQPVYTRDNFQFSPYTTSVALGANSGTNVLEGGSGDDRLATRGGDDSVYGGDGNDTLLKLNSIDVYFTDLEPQPEPTTDPANGGFVQVSRQVRVAAFSIDKIVDAPNLTHDVRGTFTVGTDVPKIVTAVPTRTWTGVSP